MTLPHKKKVWTFSLASLKETEKLASKLAMILNQGDVLLLQGDLGAGKTALARFLIRSLLNHENEIVPSPTFSLVQHYETPTLNVAHYDFYRLKKPEEVWELGIEEDFMGGVVLVEWPEKGPDFGHYDPLMVSLIQEQEKRRAHIIASSDMWQQRLQDVFKTEGSG